MYNPIYMYKCICFTFLFIYFILNRFCSLTLWVSNPQETKACLKSIMHLNIKSFIPEVLYENQ